MANIVQGLVGNGQDSDVCTESGGNYRPFLSTGRPGPNLGAHRRPLAVLRETDCGEQGGSQGTRLKTTLVPAKQIVGPD